MRFVKLFGGVFESPFHDISLSAGMHADVISNVINFIVDKCPHQIRSDFLGLVITQFLRAYQLLYYLIDFILYG
jgi:hypothetical protein